MRAWLLLLPAAGFLTWARAQDPAAEIDAAMAAGQFDGARPLAERWLEQLEKEPGRTGLDRARVLQVLGSIEDRLGRPDRALARLEKSWQLFLEHRAAPEELSGCAGEASLAASAAGQPEDALRWQERALATWKKVSPAAPAASAVLRARLAELLLQSGRVAEAAAAGRAAREEAGRDGTASCLTERYLGIEAHTMGRWEEAAVHFGRAARAAPALGPDAPAMRAALAGQTGQSLLRAGRPAAAAPLLDEAGTWFSDHQPGSAEATAALNNLAEFWLETGEPERAATRLSARLDQDPAAAARPGTLTLWLNLAAARHRLGQLPEAAAALDRAAALTESLPAIHPLRAQLALVRAPLRRDLGDPAGALAAAQEYARISLDWLSQPAAAAELRHTMDPVSPVIAFAGGDATVISAAVLAGKGAVLESLLGKAAGGASISPAAPSPATAGIPLPAGAVLVDFIRWRPCGPGGVWDAAGRYGAVIQHSSGPPQWVDLGPADGLEARLRRVIAAARDAVARHAEAADRSSLLFQLSQLWDKVWAPLLPAVAGADRLLLRPDGLLHFMPWAILTDPAGSWFCRHYPNWEVIASVRPAPARPAAGRWRVLAVPGAPWGPHPVLPDFPPPPLTRELAEEIRLMPALPGVVPETAAIRAAARAGITVEFPGAGEAGFAPPGAPADVIHFAGHGFARESPGWGLTPVLQAGLVMADAGNVLRSGLPPGTPDGLLTVSEAAGLPLQATRLVVLSGCGTGLGQWRAGEHLTGLRHAFLTAGAGAVAATLWDLNDARTPEIVREIYVRLAAGDSPAAAVHHAQREWLAAPASAGLTPGLKAALAGAWMVESAGWNP